MNIENNNIDQISAKFLKLIKNDIAPSELREQLEKLFRGISINVVESYQEGNSVPFNAAEGLYCLSRILEVLSPDKTDKFQ